MLETFNHFKIQDAIHKFEQENEQLKQEIEQLKQRVVELEKQLKSISDFCSVFKDWEWGEGEKDG